MVALGPLAPGNCTWKFGPGTWPLALAHRNLQQDHGISWLETETLTIQIHVFCSEFDMVLHDFLSIFCEIPCPWPLAICPWHPGIGQWKFAPEPWQVMIGTRNPYYRSLGFSEVGMFLIDVGPSCVKFDIDPLQFAKGDGNFWHRNLGFLILAAFKSCGLVLGERKFA